MSEKKEIIFANGMFAKKPKVDFIVSNVSFKTEEFIKFLQANTNEKGYCNIDIMNSKAGDMYCKLNDFKPMQKYESKPADTFKNTSDNDVNSSDLPF